MAPYIASHGGYLVDGEAKGSCEFCPVAETDVFLGNIDIYYEDRWRNFGILWGYVVFNIAAAVLFYWLARMPRKRKENVDPAPAPPVASKVEEARRCSEVQEH